MLAGAKNAAPVGFTGCIVLTFLEVVLCLVRLGK
jgi:hypothetical protein